MLESVGGEGFRAGWAAVRRITGRMVVYDLADGPRALVALEARATVGKLALRP